MRGTARSDSRWRRAVRRRRSRRRWPGGPRRRTTGRAIQRLYAAGLSSRTIAELLPCVDSPSEDNSDAALERMAQERDRLSEHIAELTRTRDALDGLMATARAHRERLGVTAAD
ncbi:MAG: MerR family DNA-binding protein [Actinoallomurus sp.]